MTAGPSRRHTTCDGTPTATTSGNSSCDGCDTSPRTRPTRPITATKDPHLTERPRPSHGSTGQTTTTPIHRSAHHVPPAPTNPDRPSADRIGPTADSTDTADPPEDNRVSRPRPSAPTPDAQTALRRTTRRRRDNHAGQSPGTATANPAATVPTPEHAVMRARLAAMARPRDDDDDELAALRAVLRDQQLMAQVVATVEQWPPLDDEQREVLAAMLNPARRPR